MNFGICIWLYPKCSRQNKYSLLLSIWLFAKHLSHKWSKLRAYAFGYMYALSNNIKTDKLWACAFGSMYTLRVVNFIIFWVYVFGCTQYSKCLSKLNDILGFCFWLYNNMLRVLIKTELCFRLMNLSVHILCICIKT